MASSPNASNIELGQLEYVRDGYPSLAAWIARDPDNETFVFRKFNRLAARNILHLQSKLTVLEDEIDKLDEQARHSNDFEQQLSSRRYETLMHYANDPNDPNRPEKKRVAKLDELKGLLKEYYETIMLQAQVIDSDSPGNRVLGVFRHYVDGKAFKTDTTPALPIIDGLAKDFLSDKGDLIALRRSLEEDYLSKLLLDNWTLRKRQTNDPVDRTTIYRSQDVVRTVVVISMTLAAILLIVAIISLYSVTDPKAKLGLVAMYTVLFALSVAMLTNAKRAEVFAATAAYAAVLVVFVSGDFGESGEQCLIQLEGGIFKTIACPQ